MKKSITKFDLEAAFKALDELEIPQAEKGIRANRPALNEIFSKKSKLDYLIEEYYDVSNPEELSDAKETKEAEIAKAKLARIEKIVDLDAESPDDLLTSYVGKYIVQCPQCMTLFYKNPEDVEESEDDPEIVNVSEVCQHCGNDSGYTLIGKVGVVEEEIPDSEDAMDIDLELADDEIDESEENVDEENVDATEDEADIDLEEIDLSIEDDEAEEDKQEESFAADAAGELLVEQLTEEAEEPETDENAELDITDAEFASLLQSPEFQKPISNRTAEAMLDKLDEAVQTCEEIEASVEEPLTEGDFGLLTKTLKKKVGQTKDNITGGIKNKISNAIDKFADSAMSREEKVEWILDNAVTADIKDIKLDDDGSIIVDDSNKKFDGFVIIGYKKHFKNGKEILVSPTAGNKDLVIGMSAPEFRNTYKEAEQLADGWSKQENGGPAAIYLVKEKNLKKATYLCQFFKGELDTKQDKVEHYLKTIKQDLEGKAQMKQSQSTESTVDKLEKGNKIALGDTTVEVTDINNSKYPGMIALTLKDESGELETVSFNASQKVMLLAEAVEPITLESIMESLESIDETSLEKAISKSLIETYANVAGFRLKDCSYLNETLNISGKVFFESSNVRDITYSFDAVKVENNKAIFKGLNEKLIAKEFCLTGNLTKEHGLITESFISVSKN